MHKVKTDVGRKLTMANRILVETAVLHGVEIKKVNGEKRRFRMIHGDKNYLIRSGHVINAYNNRLALRICRQKDISGHYLRGKGFPAPENASFLKGEELRAWGWAEYILPVVLKPVDGALGNMVYVNISNKEEFINHFCQIADKYGRVLVEKFCKGTDHRFLVVKGEVVGILNRVPASVTGDGKSTIKELLVQKNKERKGNPVLKQIKMDDEALRNLSKHDYDINSVPKKNEIVFLRSNANISDGADSYEVSYKISNEIKDMVKRAIKSIPGLYVCGVDVLIYGTEAHIIELNGNPMINVHYFTTCGNGVEVGKDVIKAMFPSIKMN